MTSAEGCKSTTTMMAAGTTIPAAIPLLHVSYQGIKLEIPLQPELTVGQVKEALINRYSKEHHVDEEAFEDCFPLQPSHLKVMFGGRVWSDEDHFAPVLYAKQKKSSYKLVVVSSHRAPQPLQRTSAAPPRVRDDVSLLGQAELERRKRLGQRALQQATSKSNRRAAAASSLGSSYRFGRIEVLPHLPHQEQARAILEELASDPGILACMAKHQWHVGCLSELYPEGKVGESPVCIMGLNENQGQRIRLRLRTDDLRGFRKPLSIRQVLYHELAHNVHGEHDDKFFQLMRQIEKECKELDWTQGHGLVGHQNNDISPYDGGTFRLGGGGAEAGTVPLRELAARAALMRLTAEEEEIQANCGCNRTDLFLPPEDRARTSDSGGEAAAAPPSSSASTGSGHPSDDGMDVES